MEAKDVAVFWPAGEIKNWLAAVMALSPSVVCATSGNWPSTAPSTRVRDAVVPLFETMVTVAGVLWSEGSKVLSANVAPCRLAPVMVAVTVVLFLPNAGVIAVMVGRPAITLKAAALVTVSEPVVTMTVRVPAAAAGAMVTFTTATVALETVTVLTVTPIPKLALVVPLTKFVFWPVTATSSVWPCGPCAGATVRMTGGGITWSVKACVAVRVRASVAWMVKLADCTVLGLPEMVPVAELSTIPKGRAPAVMPKLTGADPLAVASVTEYGVLVKALGSAALVVMMKSSRTTSVSACVAVLPFASVAVRVKLKVPAVARLPLSVPVAELTRVPAGIAPAVTAIETAGMPPVKLMAWL